MDDDPREYVWLLVLTLIGFGLGCLLMVAANGCQRSETIRTVAVLCATEPGGTPARYEMRSPWPLARASHGSHCPADGSLQRLCMWDGYDTIRNGFVHVYGPSCREAP